MTVRKRSFLNKLKRCFVEAVKELGESCRKLFKKFVALPSKIKIIGGIWIVIFIIILALVISSSNNKKNMKIYQGYEETINKAALEYVERNNLYATRYSKLKIDLEELKDARLITDEDVSDNSCRAYTLVYFDDNKEEYVGNTYLHCLKFKYKTDDYDTYK